MSTEFTPPIREDLVGIASYGAPQLDVPARLNVNENPFPIPADLAAAMGAAVAEAAALTGGEAFQREGGSRKKEEKDAAAPVARNRMPKKWSTMCAGGETPGSGTGESDISRRSVSAAIKDD